jgi:hypothetical protein
MTLDRCLDEKPLDRINAEVLLILADLRAVLSRLVLKGVLERHSPITKALFSLQWIQTSLLPLCTRPRPRNSVAFIHFPP